MSQLKPTNTYRGGTLSEALGVYSRDRRHRDPEFQQEYFEAIDKRRKEDAQRREAAKQQRRTK